jgi:hypothetical protein
VVADYNYESMLLYRALAQPAILLAAAIAGSSVPSEQHDGHRNVIAVNACIQLQLFYSQLSPSACSF